MRDIAEWIRGTLESRREANRQPPGRGVLGAALHNVNAERAKHSSLVVTRGTERGRIDELAAADRRKDEFLAVLGHELRNPLTSINNGIHLLRLQTQDTPARQKTQAMIERQVHRMTQLVDDLLDVSRVTYGRLRLQRVRIDLRDIVSNAIETLESNIDERRHRLTAAFPDAPVWLQADPCRLEQVFVNLLANASRYTDPGGKLAIEMHTRDDQAVVRVRDSGIGIAPEVLPHIFDLFRQADGAALRSQSGLGVGLALVRTLVESHGGSVIGASAGLGQGSEFTVFLPRDPFETLKAEDQTAGIRILARSIEEPLRNIVENAGGM
jgi:two-component system CheB/CheR fusion protein